MSGGRRRSHGGQYGGDTGRHWVLDLTPKPCRHTMSRQIKNWEEFYVWRDPRVLISCNIETPPPEVCAPSDKELWVVVKKST